MTSAESATAALPPLPYATPPQWAPALLEHTATLLVDQGHLEKKAAAGALSFLFRVPGGNEVQRSLSALAREELVHFERTLRLLAARGIGFEPLQPSRYAERLKTAISRTMPHRLADELLVAAIIEARSHERMALLARALRGRDDELATFYDDLCEAEARHESLYAALAASLLPADDLTARFDVLSRHEQAVLTALPFAPRLHAGGSP
ncbi:MAG: tRNA-(ms[2]io[6]A)-hydroxylase [Planctomycetes bacterium]|nr:tRNA-(ms[2]io[6]A)-hydroxylase [Planctomycetota bacterium]